MSVLQEEGDTEEECIFLEAGEQTVMDESDVTDQDIINRLHGMQLDHESMKLLKHQLYGHPDFFCHTKPKLSQETVVQGCRMSPANRWNVSRHATATLLST